MSFFKKKNLYKKLAVHRDLYGAGKFLTRGWGGRRQEKQDLMIIAVLIKTQYKRNHQKHCPGKAG